MCVVHQAEHVNLIASLYYCNTVRWAWLGWGLSGWLTTLLQCFDSVGLVIHQTCKNRRPYNLYCVGADVKPCSINQSVENTLAERKRTTNHFVNVSFSRTNKTPSHIKQSLRWY